MALKNAVWIFLLGKKIQMGLTETLKRDSGQVKKKKASKIIIVPKIQVPTS